MKYKKISDILSYVNLAKKKFKKYTNKYFQKLKNCF